MTLVVILKNKICHILGIRHPSPTFQITHCIQNKADILDGCGRIPRPALADEVQQ
jgi:hypothetical protein